MTEVCRKYGDDGLKSHGTAQHRDKDSLRRSSFSLSRFLACFLSFFLPSLLFSSLVFLRLLLIHSSSSALSYLRTHTSFCRIHRLYYTHCCFVKAMSSDTLPPPSPSSSPPPPPTTTSPVVLPSDTVPDPIKPSNPLASPSSGIQQKPKNLENAMWVGNLPTDTTPEELRDFFYDDDFMVRNERERERERESLGLFLLSTPAKFSHTDFFPACLRAFV